MFQVPPFGGNPYRYPPVLRSAEVTLGLHSPSSRLQAREIDELRAAAAASEAARAALEAANAELEAQVGDLEDSLLVSESQRMVRNTP